MTILAVMVCVCALLLLLDGIAIDKLKRRIAALEAKTAHLGAEGKGGSK